MSKNYIHSSDLIMSIEAAIMSCKKSALIKLDKWKLKIAHDIAKNSDFGDWRGSHGVDIDSVASYMNIEIEDIKLKTNKCRAAGLSFFDGKAKIKIPYEMSHESRNFSIAKLIGHYLLHIREFSNDIAFSDRVFNSKSGHIRHPISKDEHNDACKFAMRFLMPEDKIKFLLDNNEISIINTKKIEKNANRFGVNKQIFLCRVFEAGATYGDLQSEVY